MALLKHKDDNYGNGGYEYWRIIETNINWLGKHSHVVLCGYLTKQARIDNKQPMDCVSFDWSGTDFPFDLETLDQAGNNTLSVAYGKIKESKLNEENAEQNWFADAEDC